MSRKKVKLQWISNNAARRATFKKRRMGLLKKVQELSILCNVKACAVVYGSYEPQPEVWPSVEEAAALLRGFRNMPEHEQGRRRMDQESFLRQRTEKLREQIEKERKATREIQVELLMAECLGGARKVEDLTMEETTALGCLVEMKLKELHGRMDFLRGHQQQQQQPLLLEAATTAALPSQPPPLLLKPPSPLVQHQFSGCYLPSLPPLHPHYSSTDGGSNPKLLPDLHGVVAAAGTRSAQRMSFVDQALAPAVLAEAARRPDWILEMMGPYSHLFYEGEGVVPPLMDDGKSSWMIDPYFPFN